MRCVDEWATFLDNTCGFHLLIRINRHLLVDGTLHEELPCANPLINRDPGWWLVE